MAVSSSGVSPTTLSRSITVASGVFASGRLGELRQRLPFELIDDDACGVWGSALCRLDGEGR